MDENAPKPGVWLYDTTLRDGTQAEGFVLTVDDKLRVARKLDRLGVHFIEGGWPGSNPRDKEFFARLGELDLCASRIAAFGSTHHPKSRPEDDANLAELIDAKTPVVTLVGKTWSRHVTEQLAVPFQRNLEMAKGSVAYLKQQGLTVFFDAEHFFDGMADDPAHALDVLGAAAEGGADALVLCDTNGGSLPTTLGPIVAEVARRFPGVDIGIHCHNDGELAVANTLAAVQNGATQVQGTMGGMGERCGNANLCSIIPALMLKMGRSVLPENNLPRLTETARYVSELANQPPNRFMPYVGASAFSHKGGLHISAVEKDPALYEHVPPQAVGNSRRYLLSDLAGRAALMSKFREWGLTLSEDDPRIKHILAKIKEKENQGYAFEAAEASLELFVHRLLGRQPRFFDLMGFRVNDYKDSEGADPLAESTAMILVDGRVEHTAAMGHGPVNALDRAIRKALKRFYPQVTEVRLVDYKVRVLSSRDATAARVRVLIESFDGTNRWGTVGVSFDVLEASWQALGDSIRYKLFKETRQRDDQPVCS